MRLLGWALIHPDWCPYQMRAFAQEKGDQRCVCTAESPREDTVRKQLSVKQREKPQEKSDLSIP